MFGRIASLLHVHDFHVQHSPKLHLDPAKAMHKSDRRAAAAAPDKLSCIRGEKSQHSSLCHLTIQRSIKRSARSRLIWQLGLPSVDATIINQIRNFNSPFKLVLIAVGETHTAEDPRTERLSRCLQTHRLAKSATLKIEQKKKSEASSFVSAAVPTAGASAYLEVTQAG